MNRSFDVIVIGGGHAGAEAAWAALRLGAAVALISLDPAKIGQMSCNPAIGGLAKGQMVREVDALGGLMGLAIDATGIQFRMLNRSKGPAVWVACAQADKYRYAREIQRLLATCPNLQIIRGEVKQIIAEPLSPSPGIPGEGRGEGPSTVRLLSCSTFCEPPARRGGGRHVRGVVLGDGSVLDCSATIVTTGTFLRGLMHTGEKKTDGGRVGEAAAVGLSACLAELGLEMGRLKTGTPPRLKRQSIDFSGLEAQPGDAEPSPFSYLSEYAATGGSWQPPLPQVACHLTATHERIHQIIRANLHRAPMYSGQISSTGPRYCPSIEDKVVRFADKTSHQIFLEPEGLDTDEIYVNGISTSLPADVQEQIVRSIPGLERAEVLRWGYAVEYDMVWPTQIQCTLQTKKVAGLFLAGQINGTSGYEEAAAQGIVAGINAARYVAGREVDFVLRRDQAYIGVLIDDLVTKPPTEPYRMFTSRAEHRLHLRSDNADQRLTALGRQIGLVDDRRWEQFQHRHAAVASARELLERLRVDDSPALDYLRRSEVDWPALVVRLPEASAIASDIGRQIATMTKYQGYIARQDRQIERFTQMDGQLIPATLDYTSVRGLRHEAKQKLTKFTPRSLGQALRISGITPADMTVLAIHIDKRR